MFYEKDFHLNKFCFRVCIRAHMLLCICAMIVNNLNMIWALLIKSDERDVMIIFVENNTIMMKKEDIMVFENFLCDETFFIEKMIIKSSSSILLLILQSF